MTAGVDPRLSVPDFSGEGYLESLERIHRLVRPAAYFEVGTYEGDSLALAKCASIAVDPAFCLRGKDVVGSKPLCALFQMESDAYFQAHDPRTLFGQPIDLAFLDGMHWCEILLRDFANTEKCCSPGSVIVLHDCLPVEVPIAQRTWGSERVEPHRIHWWAGDVWRTALLLKQHRKDLSLVALSAPPTGLVLVTTLDPASDYISRNYDALCAEMHAMDLATLGIPELHAALGLRSQEILASAGDIRAIFSETLGPA